MTINSGTLRFGLVAIPVKLYPAIKNQPIRLQLPHKRCGSRVRNQVCKQVVAREDLAGASE
jgi:non-homologous end joining protein Ku